MLTHEDPSLDAVNARAAFLVADGAPLVWASRVGGEGLPERVTGSDLIFDLCRLSAKRDYRIFFLGGAPGVADEAARRLGTLYPGLRVVGVESPPFVTWSDDEEARLRDRIRAESPDLLFVSFGQPKGEHWIDRNYEALGVPVSVQIGASIDFVAGRVPRAPRRLQRLGLEWAYRMWREPARLAPRYARNARFILSKMAQHPAQQPKGPRSRGRLVRDPRNQLTAAGPES